jgi:hypothetical protein
MHVPKNDTSPGNRGKRGKRNMDILWLLGIVGIWVLLQAVILPKLGIST